MAVTRITGSKWLVKDNIDGAKTTNAAGEGQIAEATVNTYNMVDKAITPAKIDETGDYDFNSVTTVADVNVGGAANVTGNLAVNTDKFTVDSTNGNVVIAGDLTVNGDTVTANTSTLDVEDKNITVAKGGTAATANGAGLTVEITDGTDGSLVYKDTSASKFALGEIGAEDDVVTATVVQTLSGKTYDLVGDDIVGKDNVEDALRELADEVGGSDNTLYTDASAVSDSKLTISGSTGIKAVYVSGIRLALGDSNDYTVNTDGDEITFAESPFAGMNIVVDYKG